MHFQITPVDFRFLLLVCLSHIHWTQAQFVECLRHHPAATCQSCEYCCFEEEDGCCGECITDSWYFWFAIALGVVFVILLYICFAKWLQVKQRRRRTQDEETPHDPDLVAVKYAGTSKSGSHSTLKSSPATQHKQQYYHWKIEEQDYKHSPENPRKIDTRRQNFLNEERRACDIRRKKSWEEKPRLTSNSRKDEICKDSARTHNRHDEKHRRHDLRKIEHRHHPSPQLDALDEGQEHIEARYTMPRRHKQRTDESQPVLSEKEKLRLYYLKQEQSWQLDRPQQTGESEEEEPDGPEDEKRAKIEQWSQNVRRNTLRRLYQLRRESWQQDFPQVDLEEEEFWEQDLQCDDFFEEELPLPPPPPRLYLEDTSKSEENEKLPQKQLRRQNDIEENAQRKKLALEELTHYEIEDKLRNELRREKNRKKSGRPKHSPQKDLENDILEEELPPKYFERQQDYQKEENKSKKHSQEELRLAKLENDKQRREKILLANMRHEKLQQENLRHEKLQLENLRHEKLRKENLRHQKMRKEHLWQESVEREKSRDDKLRNTNLRHKKLRKESFRHDLQENETVKRHVQTSTQEFDREKEISDKKRRVKKEQAHQTEKRSKSSKKKKHRKTESKSYSQQKVDEQPVYSTIKSLPYDETEKSVKSKAVV